MKQSKKRFWRTAVTFKAAARTSTVLGAVGLPLAMLACSGDGASEAQMDWPEYDVPTVADEAAGSTPPQTGSVESEVPAPATAADAESAATDNDDSTGGEHPVIATEVHTLVEAAIVADNAIEPLVRGDVAERYQLLLDLVGAATSAADQLEQARTEEADSAVVDSQLLQLSTVAGQIPVQVKRVKQALRVSGFTPEQVKEIARGLDTMKLAAQSLALGVADERELEGLSAPTTLSTSEMLSFSTLNGPLTPGSPWYLLDEGHIDAIDIAYEDEALGISIHDESVDPDVERDPATTIMLVKPSAVVQVPDSRFAFLGPVGADVWILPESQTIAENAELLWPGIATEEIEQGVLLNDTVDVRFRSFIGPNGLSLYISPQDQFTDPTIVMDVEDGLPDVYTVPVGTHVHVNWAFEAPGIYLLEVRARGRLAEIPGHPTVNSAKANLKFVVLP